MTTIGRILGVDPGTRTVGYALLDPRPDRVAAPFDYVECGIIKANAKDALLDRLAVITESIVELLEEFDPTVLAIETAFHGRNAASALKLGQARGAILMLAAQRSIPVSEYAPASIKLAVTGHGRATKEQIQRSVTLMCGLHRSPRTDAADAIAIAICHGYHCAWDVAPARAGGARS